MSDKHLNSDARFEIGEIVLVNCPGIWSHGKEALILAYTDRGKRFEAGGKYREGFRYVVEVEGERFSRMNGPANGLPLAYFHDELKRKPIPREDLQVTRWSECPWQPKQVNV